MAEDPGLCEELAKLNKTVAEQNERIQQLEGDLKAKDNLIDSLEQKIRRLENTRAVNEMVAGSDVNSNSDLDSDLLSDSESSDENADKQMRRKSYHQNQSQSQPQIQSRSASAATVDFSDTVAAAVRAVRIPMILFKLLDGMRTRDLLKTARLVSREWRDSATEILMKRRTFKIQFEFKIQSSSTLRACGLGLFTFTLAHNSRPLQEFTSFLIDFKTFPCAHFSFNWNVSSLEAQAFLLEFGGSVKGLELIGPQDLKTIGKCLLQQTRNLESLELSKFVSREHQNQGQNPAPVPAPNPESEPEPGFGLFPTDPLSLGFKLLSLTRLKLGEGNSPGLVREILNATPNLQEVFGISSTEEIEMLRPRIHIVKGLNLKLGVGDSGSGSGWSQEALVNLLKILQQNQNQLHLTSLSVTCDPKDCPNFGGMVSEILESSQRTLRELKISLALYFDSLFHPQLPLPRLEKVEKLTLAGHLHITRHVASTSTSATARRISHLEIQHVVPNLHTIRFEGFIMMTPEHKNTLKLHFGNRTAIPTAKSLVISTGDRVMADDLLPIFLQTGITVLSLGPIGDFAGSAPAIWQMKGLKSLRLKVFYLCVLDLDVGFTGIKKSVCKFLRTSERDKFQPAEIEKSRVRPSILNLEELEELDLDCRNHPTTESYSIQPHKSGLTPEFILFKYAFNLMPKLVVSFRCDH